MNVPDNFLANSPVPVYAVALPRSDLLLYAGGGGRSRSGVSNVVRSVKISYSSNELVDRVEEKLSSEEDAPMCLAISPGEEEEQPRQSKQDGKDEAETSMTPSERLIVVGVNASLTQTGTNENLRMFEWSSSGCKSSSQMGMVDKMAELVKKQINDEKSGARTQDGDTHTIKSVRKAESVLVHDLEQYIKVTVISPTGKFLAVGSTDGQIALHAFPSLERLWLTTPASSSEVIDATFSSDSSLVAFVSPASIQIYSTKDNSSSTSSAPEVFQTIRNPSLKGTTGCVFRGARFGRVGAGKEAAGQSDRLFTVVNTNPASGLSNSKKDREKAKIRRCFISSWDTDKWTLLQTRKVSDRPATVFALSESGKHLAISTSDLNIHLLSSLTLSTIWRLKNAHAFPGTCLAFDPSGDLLVSGSADMTLRVIKVGLDQEPAIVYNLIHSKGAAMLLTLLLALMAFYLQQRIAPDLPME